MIDTAVLGSSASVRSLVAWLRGRVIEAHAVATRDLDRARSHGAEQLRGRSGSAYAAHATALLDHTDAQAERLHRAATLFEAYADRLAAHEILMTAERHRAIAGGLHVEGDLVSLGSDAAAMVDSGLEGRLLLAEITRAVTSERAAFAAWVEEHLVAAVPEFDDHDTARFLADFAAETGPLAVTVSSTFASRGLLQHGRYWQGVAEHLRGAHRSGNPERAALGRELKATGGVRGLAEHGEDLVRLGNRVGTAGPVVDTAVALSSDEPGRGLAAVGGSVLVTTAAAGLITVGTPVVIATGVIVVAGVGGGLLGEKVWDELPDSFTDGVDDAVSEAVDDAGEWVGDQWGTVRSWW